MPQTKDAKIKNEIAQPDRFLFKNLTENWAFGAQWSKHSEFISEKWLHKEEERFIYVYNHWIDKEIYIEEEKSEY